MEAKHTPTPWTLKTEDVENPAIHSASTGKIAVWCEGSDPNEDAGNAALIIRAVNAHDDLVAALKRAENALVIASDKDRIWKIEQEIALAIIRRALAKTGAP